MNTPKSRKLIGEALTSENNVSWDGRSTIFRDEAKRGYRSYKRDREKQILGHVSTQLFLALRYYKVVKEPKDIVEVQAIHLFCNKMHNLFITANNTNVTEKFSEIIERTTLDSYSHGFILKRRKDPCDPSVMR